MSRNPVLVVVSLLVGLIVGFAAGFLVSQEKESPRAGGREGATLTADERAALVGRADAAIRERDEAQKGLEQAVAELAAARDRVAMLEKGAPAGAGPTEGTDGGTAKKTLTDEEKRAKLAELEKAVEKGKTAKDGKAIIAALQELVALGEVAYPRVMELLGLVFEDMFGENQYKIVATELYMSISGKKWDNYYKWTLDNPDLDGDARRGSVEGLIWSRDPEIATYLVSKLSTEKDRSVVKAIIDNLVWKDPNAKVAIAGVLESRRDNKQIRMDAVNALWTIGDQVAMEALTKAMQGDPDPDVREAARIASRGIDPPVAGYMVNYVPSDGSSGSQLQRGDIVLAYNGTSISNTDTLGKASRGTEGIAEVPIQIYRNGEVVNLMIRGGSIDAWGRYVKPKK